MGEQEAAESTASTGGRRFESFLGQHLRTRWRCAS